MQSLPRLSREFPARMHCLHLPRLRLRPANRSYKGNSGEQQDQVSYFDCSAWGKLGETIAQYAHKGSGILISGRLEQRSWEDKEGQKRSRIEIVADDFNFIGGGNGGGDFSGGNSAPKAAAAPVDDMSDGPIDLSEIPF